ncbi:amidohydrolase family protein [Vibrio rumoiensis]|uniref:Amidohydrolase n=1 Tax=Vibrio rumoiensis 1S-45 TaxID=1188252 RepID=A0A1E5E294_9VIBR|nr:amidohydrolase family protein [Vibrio rumoiensis]OEF25552.1 amidohydrolase [Vibrio rumoiensis 1S-45]
MNYLIKDARGVVGNEFVSDIRIKDGLIDELGTSLEPMAGERIIDASQCVVYPGFVNTHHHLAQSILKGIPAGLNQPLGEWLASVPYQYWPKITPEIMYNAACLGFYDLIRSGVTTCADHHYLYHSKTSPELEAAVWQAAEDMGIRLVLCRGGATSKGTHKGLAKAGVEPESIDQMLKRLDDSYSKYHQKGSAPMRKLVVAPTSLIHSSSAQDLKQLSQYARSRQLKMHSHLLEVDFDQQQSLAKYGKSAVEFAEECEWLGDDVWFAHLVKANECDIKILASTKTGIAHCPTSNCRLGSGIAPVIDMYKKGMRISIGVDGSASSESGSMLQELNLTWLLHRAINGANSTLLEEVVEWGSRDGAALLGLENVGTIEVGAAADIVLYDIGQVRYQGCHSILYSPVLCGEPVQVKYSLVNGKIIYQNDNCLVDREALIIHAQQSFSELLKRVNHFNPLFI